MIPLLPREVDVYRSNHHALDFNNNAAFLAVLSPTVSLGSTFHAVVNWDTLLRLEAYGDVYITGRVPAHEAAGDILLFSENGDHYTVEGKVYVAKWKHTARMTPCA